MTDDNTTREHNSEIYPEIPLDTMIEYIESYRKMMDDVLAEAKRQADQIREDANDAAYALLKQCSPDVQRDFGSQLYWRMSKFIRAGTISDAVGLKSSHNVAAWAHEDGRICECDICGRQFWRPFTSRVDKRAKEDWPLTGKCPDCRASADARYAEMEKQKAEELKRLRTMPYHEYLKTEHWNETRLAALKRARFRCQVCNIGDVSLHVHHRTYENRGRELTRDLIVLCEKCHLTFHETGQLAR